MSPECLLINGDRPLNAPAPVADTLSNAVSATAEAIDAWNAVEAAHRRTFTITCVTCNSGNSDAANAPNNGTTLPVVEKLTPM